MLFYRFDNIKLHELNEIFKSNLSTDPRDYISHQQYRHLDFKTWFNEALKDHPHDAVLFNMDRQYQKSTLYKEEWKMIPKLLSRTGDVLIIGKDEYVYLKNKEVKRYKQRPDGLVKIILEIHTSMRNKYSVTGQACFDYLVNTYQQTEAEADNTIKQFLKHIKEPAFKNRIDIFYQGIEVDDGAIKDSIYKYSNDDAYLFKLLWLLFFMKNPDPIYLKHITIITDETTEEQVNPYENAENLINAIKKLTNIQIDLESITQTNEPAYTYMDEEYLDYQIKHQD